MSQFSWSLIVFFTYPTSTIGDMKYEEYEKRKKKDKEREKLKSTQSAIRESGSSDAYSYGQGEIEGTVTTLWRRRWWRFWRSKRPSSNVT